MLSYRANGIRGYTNDVRLRGLEEVTGRMEFAAIQTMSASADWKTIDNSCRANGIRGYTNDVRLRGLEIGLYWKSQCDRSCFQRKSVFLVLSIDKFFRTRKLTLIEVIKSALNPF